MDHTPTSESLLQELPDPQIPPDWETLARLRSQGVLNNLLGMLALGKHWAMSPEEIAEWCLSNYRDRGFFDFWAATGNFGNVEAFATTFINGRRMLYSDCTVDRTGETWTVTSRQWYLDPLPETFFFLGIELQELQQFATALVKADAEEMGVAIEITHADGCEIAIIKPVTSN